MSAEDIQTITKTILDQIDSLGELKYEKKPFAKGETPIPASGKVIDKSELKLKRWFEFI